MNPSRLCEIEGCEAPHRAKGLCSTHYNADRYERLGGRLERAAHSDVEEDLAPDSELPSSEESKESEGDAIPDWIWVALGVVVVGGAGGAGWWYLRRKLLPPPPPVAAAIRADPPLAPEATAGSLEVPIAGPWNLLR